MHHWSPVFSGTAWFADVSNEQGRQVYALVFFITHTVAWLFLLGSLLLMDLLELVGVKQVQYLYSQKLNLHNCI